ncbi:MFS transporter [Photobacterium sp. OFAV2-7]|uniref:MFS transporter n=1 Tax=Photobacterium sp. OFAV2-7 TaxID=2917748 RepID=UPI001EF74B25|nr:MFS transporter [Photobacterium sp. OFAV2-7]MCG7585833.1 MFS transporter [Photobacterium sp. OFAV2-7]
MSTQDSYKLSFKEKISFCLGDVGNNFAYQMVVIYLLIFYTDVFGISPLAASTMFLLARVWDAINDPIMGFIADKTNTRWGRFRPYLGWMAIPLAMMTVAVFTVPFEGMSETSKLIYAYVTYIGFGMVYTAVNVPYNSMISVLSENSMVRTKLVSLRAIMSMGAILLMSGVPAYVDMLGGGDDKTGYQLTAVIFGSLAACCCLATFFFCKERVDITTHKGTKPPKHSLGDILRSFFTNKPMLVLAGVVLLLFGLNAIQTSAGIYLFKYFLKAEEMFTLSMIIQLFSAIAGIIIARILVNKMDKKWVVFIGLVLALARGPAFLTMDVTTILAISALAGIGMGMASGIIFSFVPDCIEYGEYKNGFRIDGISNAIIGFFNKFGMALGGIIPGAILEFYDYVPNVLEQSDLAMTGFVHLGVTIPTLLVASGALLMAAYPLTRDKHTDIAAFLSSKRQKARDEAMVKLETGEVQPV